MVYFLSKWSQDMASASMNHYEKQLYSVFKTFDVDNEEALDRSAVLQLCDTLQLEDRGAALVDTLFERQSDRVTFAQFRNGLLSVLGSDSVPRPGLSTSAECGSVPLCKTNSPHHSDDDSSGREVAPKFVFGSKKYGRRSRPQRIASEDSPRHRVASESRIDSARARQRMRCKRSASAMESRDDSTVDSYPADLGHDRRVDRDRALALCRSFGMRDIDHCLVNRIFETSSTEEITVGEFFDLLNSSLTTSIAASLDGVSVDDSSKFKIDVVSSDAVVDAWERAGVERPRRLLIELGFTAAGLRPHELERALDDELRALTTPADNSPDARALLLLASHALARLRLDTAWRMLDVARAERDKLRDDLAEANRRARMLAQDVDENHARIEAELKSSLRQVEARHAEAARAAAAEAAAERERAAIARLALEEEAARRAESEARLRTETTSLQERIDDLQERVRAVEARAQQAEREQARLQEEARAAEERGAQLAQRERAALAELDARLLELKADNQRLRDRNDELCAALEASARAAAARAHAAPSWREEVAMQAMPLDSHLANNIEVSDLSLSPNEKKPLDPKEVIQRLRHVLDSIGRLPSQIRDGCPMCNSVEETISNLQKVVRELSEEIVGLESQSQGVIKADVGLQTESDIINASVDALKKELSDIKQQHEIDKQNLTSVIKELESSLEQMKLEYDKCEEYWTCKLEDERELFAEEQRAGDERLADLVAKIADYELQFAPDAAARDPPHPPAHPLAHPAHHPLPTIDETHSLELQFSDLEDEFAKYKTEKEAELASKAKEIDQLKGKVDELERRQADVAPHAPCACGGAGVAGAGAGAGVAGVAGAARWREAGALRARAARAERAAQRLHARLAAADVLVKELYIENCRLAHLPRLPRLP